MTNLSGAETSPDQIENELSRLWESQKAQNKTRASLFNLVFFTKQNERTSYVQKLMRAVIEKLPSRVLFITHATQGNALITRASVIPAAFAEADFACDLIEIEAAGSATERIPFILLSYLLPDLPIITIWNEEPDPGRPLFDQLLSISERFIFDSGVTKNLQVFFTQLLHASKKLSIADLTWARIENWRQLLSATFHTEERLHALYQTRKFHIFYNSSAKPIYALADLQAFYLKGWLASQLHWKIGDMEILLIPEEQPHLPPGCILSLELITTNQEHFSFGRDLQSPYQINMRFSTLEKCEIPLKHLFAQTESTRSLINEISQSGTSPHFLNFLEFYHALPITSSRE